MARRLESESVGRHESLQDAEQPAGKTGIGRGNHESGQFVAVYIVTDRLRAQGIVADGAENGADRRAHDTQRNDNADEIAQCQELIERPAGGEMQCSQAEIKARRRHARQAVLTAGKIRQRIELDEKENFGDGDRDHGKIDAGAAQCDQPDQIADHGCRNHADDQRQEYIGKTGTRQKPGGDDTAGAIEGRLAERQHAGVAEQNIKADAEQSPDQDPVNGVRRKAEIRQHKRRRDQPGGGQCLDGVAALHNHRWTTLFATAGAEQAVWPQHQDKRHRRE